MSCPSCGKENPGRARVCGGCGAMLDPATDSRPADSPDSRPVPTRVPPDSHRADPLLAYRPGRPFGQRYMIMERLGQGGMGVVYKAYDQELEHAVALKMIRADRLGEPEIRVRFRRELALAQRVTHPNVCRVHDLGEAEGIPYLSMEFVEGHTLAELIREVGRLSPRQTVEIADKICNGLEAIHTQHIIHRDLKPSNIGITPAARTVLMDFGIARGPFETEVTRPGTMVGTYAYLAPEQIGHGSVDERTDIYALGLILYEMLTGRRPPGDSDPRPLALRGEKADCPPPSHHERDVPRELDRLVLRCLAWDREDRPSSVPNVRAALQTCRAQLESEPKITLPPDPKPWLKLFTVKRTLAAAAVLLVLLALGARERWIDWLRPPPRPASSQTLAVLPFTYIGEDSSQAYLGSLVAEALIAGLRPIAGVSLAPYETVHDHPPDAPIVDVARRLGVRWVAQGQVEVKKNVLLLRAELYSAEGKSVWRGTMEAPLAQHLQGIEQLREALLKELRVGEGLSREPLAQLRTPSAAAYSKYLEALRHHDRWDIPDELRQAMTVYREALRLDPDFAAARAGLARALITQFYQVNDPSLVSAAREEVVRARALAPDLPETLVATGFQEEASGNSVQAEVAYRKAVEVSPGNDGAYRVQADFYADLGRHQEALELYQRMVSLRPGYWRNHYALGRFHLYFTGNLEAARQEFEKAHQYYPDGLAPKVGLGNIHLSRGQLDEAETWFRRAVEQAPDPMGHYNLGVVYYYKGQFDLALRTFETASRLSPDNPFYLLGVADAYRQQRNFAAARSRYERVLQLYQAMLAAHPEYVEKRSEYAIGLAGAGQCSQAGVEMKRVLDTSPGSPKFSAHGAYAAILCGDAQEAARLALAAVEGGDVLLVGFNPDLAPVRQETAVRAALERAGVPLR